MIPALSTIVGAYVMTRCLEMILRDGEGKMGQSSRAVVAISAIITVLVSVISLIDIYSAGSRVSGLGR